MTLIFIWYMKIYKAMCIPDSSHKVLKVVTCCNVVVVHFNVHIWVDPTGREKREERWREERWREERWREERWRVERREERRRDGGRRDGGREEEGGRGKRGGEWRKEMG